VRTSRLEAFCDGVFAIAATLLILELRVPADSSDLVASLLGLWPAYAVYLVSFMTIGIIWVNHHTLLEHCKRVDRRFLYLNLLLLVAVGIVPFPTALVGTYILSPQWATAVLVVYGIGAVLIAIGFSGVFFYATTDGRLMGDAATARRVRAEGRFFPIGLGGYSLGIALAFISPVASLALYALMAVFYALPILPLPRR
jgi:uncharacterized membrane protein